MKNYTPHHLYEIYDYRPDWGSDAPRLPTTKDLIDMKKGWVKGLESDPDEYDMKDIIREIMADDHTEQDEMIDFTEKLDEKFQLNLEAICNAANILDDILEKEMTKEEILEWVDCARDTLVGTLPQTQSVTMWDKASMYHKGIRAFLKRVPSVWKRRLSVGYSEGNPNHLRGVPLEWSTDITIRGGSLCIISGRDALLVNEKDVRFTNAKGVTVTTKIKLLDEVFTDWVHPTEGELTLFEMLYGYSVDIRDLIRKLESDPNPN